MKYMFFSKKMQKVYIYYSVFSNFALYGLQIDIKI